MTRNRGIVVMVRKAVIVTAFAVGLICGMIGTYAVARSTAITELCAQWGDQ